MRRTVPVMAAFSLVLPALAMAHITVRPRESKPGAEERYTVRVPTEGAVPTTSVHFEIPAGVTVLDVEETDGAAFETQKQGDLIVGITWRREIKPKDAAEFFFRARNPSTGPEIVWKAHQHFADGTVADWVGPAGDRRPAPVTKLVAAPSSGGAQPGTSAAARVEAWLKAYDAAFNAKDLDRRTPLTSSRTRKAGV